tara:strand:+ start:144029 stop:146299 length:2271 start_codon:yes stop_codon:yes gene_type:complete
MIEPAEQTGQLPETLPEHKVGTAFTFFGLICIGTLALLRAMVEHDPFPMWGADPFVFAPPAVGLSPVMAIVLNLGVVLAGCFTLIGIMLRRGSIGLALPVLLAIGAATIAYHALQSIETVLDGSNLLAIVTVLFVASLAHTIPSAQQILGAISISFAIVLVLMGAYEMFVLHPNMLAEYHATRDFFLAARGWSPDSVQALGYERRLNQAEPIAWFGLTNVFASFAGASSAGLFMLGWSLKRAGQPIKHWGWAILGGAVALLGLLMTGAKGGLGALALAIVISVIAMLLTKRRLDGRIIIAGCVVVLLGVLCRGLLGERLSELSMLFRAQYAQGSVAMFLDHPVVGVGPGAFQEHYMVLKPDLSPEDVSSAHSVVFDLLATLGFGGLALIGLFVGVLRRIRPTLGADPDVSKLDQRRNLQIIALCIAIISIVSIRIGSPAMDVNLLLVQALASLAWGRCAIGLYMLMDHAVARRWALFACAAVLSIHAMIELTPTWIVSGLLWALMIGQAATTSGSNAQPRKIERLIPVGLVVTLLGVGSVIGSRLPTLIEWELKLSAATAIATDFQDQRAIADPLAIADLEFDARGLAIDELLLAANARPTHTKTWIAATQQMLWQGSALLASGHSVQAGRRWQDAANAMEAGADASTGAGGYQWLGKIYASRAETFPTAPDRTMWLREAQEAWEAAFLRSPHDPFRAINLMENAIELGDQAAAYLWAQVVINLNDQRRLDPLSQLGERPIMRARTIVARGVPSEP